MDKLLTQIVQDIERFLQKHAVGETFKSYGVGPLTGEFALHREQSVADLYGMIDAVYILSTIGKLQEKTDRDSRRIWAKRILACQDEQGWFSKLNLRGHSHEHATAYAIGALRLLEIELGEHHLEQIQPLTAILPIFVNHSAFLDWIVHLGFRFSLRDIASKNLGWHHIWRGSHIGGGVAAIIGMTSSFFKEWWSGTANSEEWFNWYFKWLNAQTNPKTGYWQRAFWNWFYRKPTVIDMGGAVHFFWIYEALAQPFPYPEQVLLSTLQLQRKSGLYKDYPFCIDLDGNFCVIRSFLQLSKLKQQLYRERVYQSATVNFERIVKSLVEHPLEKIYTDSHGLPGALAALTECTKLPGFKYTKFIIDWQHPLDCVWWL